MGLLAILGHRAMAQKPAEEKKYEYEIKEPLPYRVYQRDRSDRATIPIVVEGKGVKILRTQIQHIHENPQTGQSVEEEVVGVERNEDDNTLVGVPVGGPYIVRVQFQIGDEAATTWLEINPIFVGDLWVLAGQSNMEGVGNLIDVTPPNDRVMLLGMDGKWAQAKEPLHWLVDSPDPVHSGDPSTREERSKRLHRTRTKGAGLGLPFGVVVAEATEIPIGLIACAHGGTSMAQWDPAKKGEGGQSLYGSMLRQVKLAGGKVKGVLWYQGESDANEAAAAKYPQVFADFIAAVRSDFDQPDLPFYFVQIGRFIRPGDSNPTYWNAVQEAQRLIPDRVAHTAVISVVDLELDDLIHVGTQGLKRAGTRLARIALREQYGQVGASTPTLDRVFRGPNNTLVVTFKGVNRAGRPEEDPEASLLGLPGVPASALGTARFETSASPVGLLPERHIRGFSIRKEDGTEIPSIFEASVGPSKDTVILKLIGEVPKGANLWYGYGLNPDCNLGDALDMAVPVFGPVKLDEIK
jgi:sialate O-acetylesterase